MQEMYETMKLSADAEVKTEVTDWGNGEQEIAYYIRKKTHKLNKKYVKLFGFDIECIKQLTLKQF